MLSKLLEASRRFAAIKKQVQLHLLCSFNKGLRPVIRRFGMSLLLIASKAQQEVRGSAGRKPFGFRPTIGLLCSEIFCNLSVVARIRSLSVTGSVFASKLFSGLPKFPVTQA